jgi:hypothetical protein
MLVLWGAMPEVPAWLLALLYPQVLVPLGLEAQEQGRSDRRARQSAALWMEMWMVWLQGLRLALQPGPE